MNWWPKGDQWAQDHWNHAGWHGNGDKGISHWKGGKGKGSKGGKGAKGKGTGGTTDVSAYTEGDLVAEDSLGWGVSGACFRGVYQTDHGPVPVAIKPAQNSCETKALARILGSDPPLPCVVPVLLVQYATPAGEVNVAALASHGTLASLLGTTGRPDATSFLAIIASIADGLQALHSKGIIHCDLKPDNVVLHVLQTGEVCLWLIDFGDCRLLEEPASWHTQGPGAPEIHCQPDNETGRYSTRTDSWCLAQCAAMLWAGGESWPQNPARMECDMPLKEELQKCLAWEPSARFEAAEIACAARAALDLCGGDVQSELQKFHDTLVHSG